MNLIVEREIEIQRPVDKVFAAWSTAEMLAKWFAPMAVETPEVSLDFSVGGEYKILMNLGNNHIHTTRGVFKEIVDNEKLVMTWHCDAFEEPETQVTVLFLDEGQKTIVKIIHQGFATDTGKNGHDGGWVACLSGLKTILEEVSQ